MPKVKTWQLAAGAAAVGLAIGAGTLAAAGPWDSGQRKAERDWAASQERTRGAHHGRAAARTPQPAPSAPSVLAALGAPAAPGRSPDPVPPPTSSGLADALAPLLKDPALGPVRTAAVVDAETGEQVFGAKPGDDVTPASTIKIGTAVAALTALGADHRIATDVRAAPGDGKLKRIVLVGGGDPTLTAREDASGGSSLRALADDTARALKDRGTARVALGYDTSLYSGPSQHPIGPNENLTYVSPLMADEGRLDDSDYGPAARTGDPAGDAARKFAGFLRDRGITLDGDPRIAEADAAETRAEPLARTRSLPLSAIVERMLTHSDNDIAEALARQTAVASDKPGSFTGAGQAVADRLTSLGLPLDGTRFADGSGLDRDDKVSAALLAQLLVRAADPQRPELRSVLTGLPIAGFSGTLRQRYDKVAAGTGMVRAKTGTLTGVNTLAGTVVDADGRLLVFAFMTTGTHDPQGAQAALDRMASAVANCGCR